LRGSTSNDVLIVKIGPTSLSVGARKNLKKSEVNIRRFWVYISGMWGAKPPGRIEPQIFLEEGIRDVITCFKFGDDRFRGLASAEGQILPFPIDFDGRPYNTLTLPCERVITRQSLARQCWSVLACVASQYRTHMIIQWRLKYQQHNLYNVWSESSSVSSIYLAKNLLKFPRY